MTLVDDQGIDCVVRLSQRKYVDIQIKARSKNAKQHHTFAAMSFRPRKNLYFIFYTEKDNKFWVIPSRCLARICYRNKGGKNAAKQTLILPNQENEKKAKRFLKFEGEKGFALLRRHTTN